MGGPVCTTTHDHFDASMAFDKGGTGMAASLRRGRRRWIWITLILVTLALGGGAFVFIRANARNKQTLSSDDLDLRIGKSETADIQVTVNEVGTIEPVVKVDVKSSLSGKVTELLVKAGDRVKRGQVLAQVEPDVNQAQTLSE